MKPKEPPDDGSTYIHTQGYGDAGSGLIGRVRDNNDQRFGPGIFDHIDSRAARYARRYFEGC